MVLPAGIYASENGGEHGVYSGAAPAVSLDGGVTMKLKLVKLERKYRRHLEEMLEEWYGSGEKIVPYSIRRLDYRDFEHYLQN